MLKTEQTIFIGKIYSTRYVAESKILPTSYCKELLNEAKSKIHELNVSQNNVTLRVDNQLFGKAFHVLILAENGKEAKIELDKIPRPKQSPIFYLS